MDRPQKITFAEMREMGVRGVLVYCADYHARTQSQSALMPGPTMDVEPRFICRACGNRGADVRPDFNWDKKPVRVMGYFRLRKPFSTCPTSG
jgi:hypothetical protein